MNTILDELKVCKTWDEVLVEIKKENYLEGKTIEIINNYLIAKTIGNQFYGICPECGLEDEAYKNTEKCIRCNHNLDKIEKDKLSFDNYMGERFGHIWSEMLLELKNEESKEIEMLSKYIKKYYNYCYKNNIYSIDKLNEILNLIGRNEI